MNEEKYFYGILEVENQEGGSYEEVIKRYITSISDAQILLRYTNRRANCSYFIIVLDKEGEPL